MLFSLCIFLCFSHVCLLRRPVEAKPVQTQLFTERDLGCARCLLIWRSVLASITINESGKHFLGLFTSIIDAVFSHFCYVGGFGDLGDPVVPTLRGVSGDVVTVYAH